MSIPMVNYPNFRPYSNVQPFTVRDGATYLLTLEALKDWIRDALVPHLDGEMLELVESWQNNISTLVDAVNAALTSQSEDVTQQLETQQFEFENVLNQVINNSIELQDTVLQSIFNDPDSEFRELIDGLYASKSSVESLETLTESGRLSEAELDISIGQEVCAQLSEHTYVYEGALADINAPRPNTPAAVLWRVWDGGKWPTNTDPTRGDTVEFVAGVNVEDFPFFSDDFEGPASLLGLSKGGRKLAVMSTTSNPSGSLWYRTGDGAAYAEFTGGNASCVWDGKAPDGTLVVTLSETITNFAAGVVFRCQDYRNMYTLSRSTPEDGFYTIRRITDGSTASETINGHELPIAPTDRIALVLSGDKVTVSVNGLVIFEDFTIASFTTATRFGLRSGVSGAGNAFVSSIYFEGDA